MKYLLFIICLLIIQPVQAIPTDKALHFGVSTGLGLSGQAAFKALGCSQVEASVFSFLLVTSIGAWKETQDAVYDRDDMKANILGALTGSFLMVWIIEF